MGAVHYAHAHRSSNQETPLNLLLYARVVRQGLWILAACTLIGAALGAAVAYTTPPTYDVKSTVYVTVTGTDNASELQSANVYIEQKAPTWAILATADPVLKDAVSRLADGTTVAALRESVSATARDSSGIIDISVRGSDPRAVADHANAVAGALISTISAPSEQPRDSSIQATSVAPAGVPTYAVAPQPRYNITAGAVVGLILGVALLLIKHALDTRIYSLRDLPTDPIHVLKLAVPRPRTRGRNRARNRLERREALRSLRTQLQFGADEVGRSIAVAPVGPESDVLRMADEICEVFAEVGLSVVLVDADLHHVSTRHIPGSDLVHVEEVSRLLDRHQSASTARSGDGDARNPDLALTNDEVAQLLSTNALPDVIVELESRYAVVVIACSPLTERADAAAVAAVAGTSLVIVRGGSTRRESYRSALGSLKSVRARSIGVVLEQTTSA